MCLGGLGKIVNEKNHYSKEFYFILDEKIKTDVINLLQTVNWCDEYKMTTVPNLLQWQVYQYLDKNLKR